VVAHRNTAALSGFLVSQGHRWLEGVKVVVSDGSSAYRTAIQTHLGHATYVLDPFHVARWFAAGMIEVRRRVQRIGPTGPDQLSNWRSSRADTFSSPGSTSCPPNDSKPSDGPSPVVPT
jgi:transposase